VGNATTGGTATNSSKSGNTVASNNTDADAKGSGNATTGGSANNTKTWDNNNNQSKNYSDSHANSSVNTITATVSNQDLSGSVSDIRVKFDGQNTTSGAATGAITGNTYTSFAGIQTANSNTGIGSLGQAATSIAANANVTFGTP
jgi:hypothetical protein